MRLRICRLSLFEHVLERRSHTYVNVVCMCIFRVTVTREVPKAVFVLSFWIN